MVYRRQMVRRVRRTTRRALKKGFKTAVAVGNFLALRKNFRKRNGGSKTITKNKLKNKPQKLGGAAWKSSVTFGRYKAKPPRSIKDTNEMYNNSYQTTERIINSTGKQGVGGKACSVYDLLDLQNVLGSSSTAQLGENKNYYLKNSKLQIIGTNAANVTMKVIIYNVVSRRDQDELQVADTIWQNGYIENGLTIQQKYTYGASPFDVGRFTTAYKVWKVTEHLLGAGESFVHNAWYNPNRRINMLQVANLTNNTAGSTNAGGIKGLTQNTIIVMQPFPAHSAPDPNNITIPEAALDLVYIRKYTNYQMNHNMKAIFQNSLFNTTYTGLIQEMEDLDSLQAIIR